MTKHIIAVALGVAALTAAAYAGTKQDAPVKINQTLMIANGSAATARKSADSQQLIGCMLQSTNGQLVGFCYARDAAGTYIQCQTFTPSDIQAIQSVNGGSFIQFSWNGVNCTGVSVVNDSSFASK